MYTNGLADDEHKAFETCIEDTNINLKSVHFVDLRHTINVFPLLHRAYCQVTQLFSLQWKIDASTTHYLTQMLLASNWRYRQAGKNSRMRTKVQGRLMQAR